MTSTHVITTTHEISTTTTHQISTTTSNITHLFEDMVSQLNKAKERRFDGLSFFGGMIFVTIIVIILFFSYKYHKKRKSGNNFFELDDHNILE